MAWKSEWTLGAVFYAAFLFFTPLGAFNDWIPPETHTGYYSATMIDAGDDAGYYAYLRSAFFDQDLDFLNERNYAHIERFNPTGYVFNNWQIGQAVLYLPFFLLGHLLALTLRAWGYAVSVDGYSAPYHMATAIAAQTYMFAGLVLLASLLRRYYSAAVAVIAALATWLAAPTPYYTFIRQRMAHSTEFFVAVALLWLWLRYRESEDRWAHALLGAVFGFLLTVRMINVLYAALYAVDQIGQFCVGLKDGGGKPPRAALQEKMLLAACFAGSSLGVFAPQLYEWNQVNGSLYEYVSRMTDVLGGPAAQHSAPLGEKLRRFAGKVYELLFGPQWPFVFATPVWFAGFWGLLFCRSFSRSAQAGMAACATAFLGLLLFTVPQASYGNRYLIPASCLFAFGLAALLERARERAVVFGVSLALLAVCMLAQFAMLAQFGVYLLYDDPEYTFKALAAVAGLFGPDEGSVLSLQIKHLLISTNFFRLLALPHPGAWNLDDLLHLILFPAWQFAAVLAVIWLAERLESRGQEALASAALRRWTLAGWGAALLLMVAIGYLAPVKSAGEISRRRALSESLKLSDALVAAKKLDEAQAHLQKSVSIMPDFWGFYFRLGLIFDFKEDYRGAVFFYRKALSLYPDHPMLVFYLGVRLYSLGDLAGAEKNLRAAVRLQPHNRDARQLLEQVRGRPPPG